MVTVLPRWQKPTDRLSIDVTSHSDTFGKGLSPFYLGPITLYGGFTAKKMENAWQYTKVYEPYSNGFGEPTEQYWEWARDGWNATRAHRYPCGKGAKPLYCWWDGKAHDYISARWWIYIPLYKQVARDTYNYRMLSNLYKELGQITLLDFDAYDHRALGYEWKDVIADKTRKMGHAFVLAMMLEEYI